MTREHVLRRKISLFTWLFIIGLVISGVTAIPLVTELNLLVKWFGADSASGAAASTELNRWLLLVRDSLVRTQAERPFLFYGADWLAFGHFVIAIAFFGPLRDPVRNRWIYVFGMIACVLVIPYAFVFGGIRGIPIWWRLIDCSFGVIGFVPLWLCHKWSGELETIAPLRRGIG